MSELPEGWSIGSVEELAGIDGLVSDGDWIESKDQDKNGSVRLIQLMDIGEGEFRDRSKRFLTKKTADRLKCTFLKEGDVLVARMPDPLGRTCRLPNIGQDAVTAVDVFIWRGGEFSVQPDWLVYALNSPSVRSDILGQTSGTTRQRISGGKLKNLQLWMPPVPEQKRVVAKLDSLTGRSARAREELDRIPRLVARYKQAVLAAEYSGAFSQNADHLKVCRSDLSRLLRTDRIPSSWDTVCLGDVAEIRSGITLGKKRKAGIELIQLPYLRVANVQRGWLNLNEIKTISVTPTEAEKLYLQPGDVLMNEGGDRDKLGRGWVWEGQIENCIHQNHVFRVRLKDTRFPPYFLSYFANEFGQRHFFEEGTQTTNLASISKRKLSAMPVPLPPSDVAEEIVRRNEHAFSAIDRLAAEHKQASTLLDKLDQSILAKAFRGELVPQDPNDEPASILLERIRAERAAAPKPKRGPRTVKKGTA